MAIDTGPPPRRHRTGAGLLLEGLVILISILVAFVLEGWRADRELRRDVVQELASVQRELERNQELARLEIATLDRILPAGNAVVAAMDEARGQPTVSIPDTLAWLATGWNPSFNPSLGAVDALISSGRLAYVEDPELRLGLAGLQDVMTDALEEEIFAREINVTQVLPLVGATYAVDFRIGNEFFASTGEGLTLQERVARIALESREDVQFPAELPIRNAIVHRMGWFNSARAEFDRLHNHLADLVELITDEVR